MSEQTKMRISVSEMARTVGLSRSRFYQLIGSAFPQPQYDAETRRPFYDAELQETCAEVRRRNCGVDGKPLMFYRKDGVSKRRQRVCESARKQRADGEKYDDLLQDVRALGLTKVTTNQMSSAMTELFPGGIGVTPKLDVLKAVFVYLEQQEPER